VVVIHISDQTFCLSFLELVFKKSNNMGIKYVINYWVKKFKEDATLQKDTKIFFIETRQFTYDWLSKWKKFANVTYFLHSIVVLSGMPNMIMCVYIYVYSESER
jgi:hypothetical protein